MVKAMIFYRHYSVTHAVFGRMWMHDYLLTEVHPDEFHALETIVRKKSCLSDESINNIEITGFTILPND